jgi:hypothetical protein
MDYLLFFALRFEMRIWCAILIAALAIHLLCSGSCLSQTILAERAKSTDPPCHQHSSNSADTSVPHQDNRPCSQGLLLEAKGGITFVYLSIFAAELPDAIQVFKLLTIPVREVRDEKPPDGWSRGARTAILRI